MISLINIQSIVAIAKEAGDAIMKIYDKDFEIEYKKDSSPLTVADKKANSIIESGLKKLSIVLPILSEEGSDVPYLERKNWNYYWLVDPLDGTKEFIKKNGEFTVNIALIHKEFPVLGVVYAPALDVCYWAKKGEGSFKNGKILPIKEKVKQDVCKIVVSRSHMSNETQEFIDNIDAKKELVMMGSSLKICLVAEGVADIYPRLGPTMEWDTAAAHAVVSESGREIINFTSGKAMKYNKKEGLLNSSFIVK